MIQTTINHRRPFLGVGGGYLSFLLDSSMHSAERWAKEELL